MPELRVTFPDGTQVAAARLWVLNAEGNLVNVPISAIGRLELVASDGEPAVSGRTFIDISPVDPLPTAETTAASSAPVFVSTGGDHDPVVEPMTPDDPSAPPVAPETP